MKVQLQLKPEFIGHTKEIAEKYVTIGLRNVFIVSDKGIIIGDADDSIFERLTDNEWMAEIGTTKNISEN